MLVPLLVSASSFLDDLSEFWLDKKQRHNTIWIQHHYTVCIVVFLLNQESTFFLISCVFPCFHICNFSVVLKFNELCLFFVNYLIKT